MLRFQVEWGIPLGETLDPLKDLVPESVYASMLRTRANVFAAVRAAPKYLDEKYAKNQFIAEGRGVGGQSEEGLYSGALSRYQGGLYSVPKMKPAVQRMLSGRRANSVDSVCSLWPPASP